MITKRLHWTEAQEWKNSTTGEVVTAGELLQRNNRYFRINRMPGLCDATFSVRDETGHTWDRVRTESR